MKFRLIAAVAVVVVLAGGVAFSQEPRAIKLEGAWVARLTSFNGIANPFPSPVGWSYTLAPDPSGRKATLHGSVDLGLPGNPPPPPGTLPSPLIGECVVTGTDTARCFVIWYGVLKGTPFDTIISIGTVHSEVTITAPGRSEVTHNFAIYAPDADKDGDGFPDPGAKPLKTFTVTTLDTRVGHD